MYLSHCCLCSAYEFCVILGIVSPKYYTDVVFMERCIKGMVHFFMRYEWPLSMWSRQLSALLQLAKPAHTAPLKHRHTNTH